MLINMIVAFIVFWTSYAITIDMVARYYYEQKVELKRMSIIAAIASVVTVLFLSGVSIIFHG